eukprot:6311060-Amphidinium_carterae.1
MPLVQIVEVSVWQWHSTGRDQKENPVAEELPKPCHNYSKLSVLGCNHDFAKCSFLGLERS